MRLFQRGGDSQAEQYEDESMGVPQSQMVPRLPGGYGEDSRWQYELDDVLQRIENFLRGRVLNPETGKYRRLYQPMMTDDGINHIMSDLSSHLHKGVFLSNLSREDIDRKMKDYMRSLTDWLYCTYDKYKIDTSNLSRICENVDTAIFTALMKPLDDKERTHRGQVLSINKSENTLIDGSRRKRFGLF